MTAALPRTCPSWCVDHDVVPDSDGSTLIVHRGAWLDGRGRVRVRQGVYVETDGTVTPSPATLVLNGDEHDLADTRELVAAMALGARTVELT